MGVLNACEGCGHLGGDFRFLRDCTCGKHKVSPNMMNISPNLALC